jgi:hypothetical protein
MRATREAQGKMKLRAVFKKHFNKDGEGDDFPTDFFHPPAGAIDDMILIEVRPPTMSPPEGHDVDEFWDEPEWAYGEEEFEIETDYPDAIEFALRNCSTCISYSRVENARCLTP